jgi:hypothetical protein
MQKGSHMRVSLMAVLAVAFVLALGGTALAQTSPTDDAYGGVLGNEVSSNDSGGGATAPVTTTSAGGADDGSLPFTGFEVAFVVLAGIGLVTLGFALRRGVRRPAA